MVELKSDELAELASLIVTLMIFFSIDAKFRFSRGHGAQRALFRWASITGGLATVLALTVVWIELFLPDGDKTIHFLVYFVPTSIAIATAFVLAIEVILLKPNSKTDEEG